MAPQSYPGKETVREAVATELIAHGEFSTTINNNYSHALLAADEVIKIVLAHTTNAALSGTPAQRPRDPEVVAAVQRALMKHPHFTGGPQTAFGFANTAIDAYILAVSSTDGESRG